MSVSTTPARAFASILKDPTRAPANLDTNWEITELVQVKTNFPFKKKKKRKDKHGENFSKFVFVFQMSTNVLAAHARSSASILQDLSLAFALLATSLTTTFAKVKTFKNPNSDLACFHDLSNYLCIFVWKNNKKQI